MAGNFLRRGVATGEQEGQHGENDEGETRQTAGQI